MMNPTTIEKNPKHVANADHWIRMGNKAVQPNTSLWEISTTYDIKTADAFPSLDLFKIELKKKMARDLAEHLVESMTFTTSEMCDMTTGDITRKVFGRAYIINFAVMQDILNSTIGEP